MPAKSTLQTLGRSLLGLALAAGCAAGIGLAPAAGAQPGALPPFNPDCGDPGSGDLLWQDVKGATPANKKGAVDVVFPANDDWTRGYALRHGKKAPADSTYDFLLIPTQRVRGIECGALLKNPPEYFTEAYRYVASAPNGLPAKTDWALGIESAENRSFDQLHVHVARLNGEVRKSINAAAAQCGSNESQWLASKITIKNASGEDRMFRCWNSGVMTHNFFGKINEHIAAPLKVSMSTQTLLIVANHTGSGFLVLSSDKAASDLNKKGVNTIEAFLNKG